jgi:uncharacterized protein with PIN domain
VSRPVCIAYAWMGQSFKYCDRCGNPYWEHTHYDTARKTHPGRTFRRLISASDAAAVKAKWDH